MRESERGWDRSEDDLLNARLTGFLEFLYFGGRRIISLLVNCTQKS